MIRNCGPFGLRGCPPNNSRYTNTLDGRTESGSAADKRRELATVEDVDVRIRGAEQQRIDGEEEPPRLDLIVLDVARLLLDRPVADDELDVLHDVALLLRGDGRERHRTDLARRPARRSCRSECRT